MIATRARSAAAISASGISIESRVRACLRGLGRRAILDWGFSMAAGHKTVWEGARVPTVAALAVAGLCCAVGCVRENPDFSDSGATDSATGTGTGTPGSPRTGGADPTVAGESNDGTTDTMTGGTAPEPTFSSGMDLETGPAAVCGNGVVEEDESCDDENENPRDGCVGCRFPASCLELLKLDDEVDSGMYKILPIGARDFVTAFCDMETDGGGYTFFKIEGETVKAEVAEDRCAEFGMQLWIPRTPDHLEAGVEVALDPGVPPTANIGYLEIMGVRPKELGSTCGGQPLNSDNENCGWEAADGETFFVTDSAMGPEPNGDSTETTVVSMQYFWSDGGELADFNDWPGGWQAPRFLCDVGDKF